MIILQLVTIGICLGFGLGIGMMTGWMLLQRCENGLSALFDKWKGRK